MRILLSSVGRRGYLVKYFKQSLGNGGQVWGVDSSQYAPGFTYCDRRYVLPGVSDPAYGGKLLALCMENQIDIVIPLIDPELNVLAAGRDKFQQNNIMVVVSPLSTIGMTFDKYQTWQWACNHDIAMPWTVLAIEEALGEVEVGRMKWPLVVKPRKGSASSSIAYCNDEIQLRGAFDGCPEPMIQQFVNGPEFGYDLFGDDQFRPVSVFCKKKLAMRAGETDKAVSTNDKTLIAFGEKLLRAMQLFGPADVDVILSPTGPQLLEINPRFGGGYPCAHLAGADFCRKLIDIRQGKPVAGDIGSCPEGVCMLKQDEIIRPDWNNNLPKI
jgi:carbamoyl-phosphate synthase large subunit